MPIKQILYIEDDVNDQRFVHKVLKTRGYEILLAASGPEGIEMATRHALALILVDVQMVGMDGLETARRLRQIPACQQVPIVALTAYLDWYRREEYLAAGFTDYQLKQAGIQPLLELVKRYVETEPVSAESTPAGPAPAEAKKTSTAPAKASPAAPPVPPAAEKPPTAPAQAAPAPEKTPPAVAETPAAPKSADGNPTAAPADAPPADATATGEAPG